MLLLAGAGCLQPLGWAQPAAGSAFPHGHGLPDSHSLPAPVVASLVASSAARARSFQLCLPHQPQGQGGWSWPLCGHHPSALLLALSLPGIPARRLNGADLLHEPHTASSPVTTQLFPHHRLCEGDPGLLSTVQLVTVVVHQLGGGIRPLCSYLGCSAKWYGDKVAVPSTRAQEPAPARSGTVVVSGVCFGAK